MKSLITTTIIALIGILNLSSQSKIDAVVAKYENKIQNITFSEKRNPKTKKVYKSTRFLVITDENIAKELNKAINEERENAIEFNSVSNNSIIINIVFLEDNAKLEYSLIQHTSSPNGNIWHLSIEKTISTNRPNQSYNIEILEELGYNADSLLLNLDNLKGLNNIYIYNHSKKK